MTNFYLKKRLAYAPSAPLDPFYPIATAYLVDSSVESKSLEVPSFQVMPFQYQPPAVERTEHSVGELFNFATQYRRNQQMSLAIPCLVQATEHPSWNQLTALNKAQVYNELSLNHLMQGNECAKLNAVDNALRNYDWSRDYCLRAIHEIEEPSPTPGLVIITPDSIRYRRILITLGMSHDRVCGNQTPIRMMEWESRVDELRNATPTTRQWMDPLLSVVTVGLEAAVWAGKVDRAATIAVWTIDQTLRFYSEAKTTEIGGAVVPLSVDELMVSIRTLANVFDLIRAIPLRDTHFAELKPFQSGIVALLKDAVLSVPEDRLRVSITDLRSYLSEIWTSAPLKSGRGDVIAATYPASVGCGCAVM